MLEQRELPSRDRIPMTDREYQIKLYGHSDENPETFCERASHLLGIDPSQFRRLLDRAPVTVKQGLEKDQAVRLLRALKSIHGLAIIESEDGSSTDVDLEAAYGPEAARLFPTAQAPPQSDAVPLTEQKERSRFRVWTGLLIGVASISVILGGAAYFFSYREVKKDTARMDRARSERSGEIRAQKNAEEIAQTKAEIADLNEQIQFYESAIEELKKQVTSDTHAVAKAYNDSMGRETTELILRRSHAETTKAELKEALGILQNLRDRLARAQERQRFLAR